MSKSHNNRRHKQNNVVHSSTPREQVRQQSTSQIKQRGPFVHSQRASETTIDVINKTTWSIRPLPESKSHNNRRHKQNNVVHSSTPTEQVRQQSTSQTKQRGPFVHSQRASHTTIDVTNKTTWSIRPLPESKSHNNRRHKQNNVVHSSTPREQARQQSMSQTKQSGPFVHSQRASHTTIDVTNKTTWSICPLPESKSHNNRRHKQNNVVHSSTSRQLSTSQTKQSGPFVHSQRASQTTIDVTNKTTWSIRPLPESKSDNNRRHKQNNVVHSSTHREQVTQQSTSQTKQRGPFVHSQRASQTTIDVTNKTTWSIRPLPESKSHNNRRHKQNKVVHSSTPREQVRQQSTSQTKQRGPFVYSQRASQTTIDVTNKTTWSIRLLPESKSHNNRRHKQNNVVHSSTPREQARQQSTSQTKQRGPFVHSQRASHTTIDVTNKTTWSIRPLRESRPDNNRRHKQNKVVHTSTPREQVTQQSTSQTKQSGPFVHSQRASETTIDITNKTTWSIRPLPESKSDNNRRHKQNNVVHSSTHREQVTQQSTSQTKQRGTFVHSQRASQTTIDVTNKTTWSIRPITESKSHNNRRHKQNNVVHSSIPREQVRQQSTSQTKQSGPYVHSQRASHTTIDVTNKTKWSIRPLPESKSDNNRRHKQNNVVHSSTPREQVRQQSTSQTKQRGPFVHSQRASHTTIDVTNKTTWYIRPFPESKSDNNRSHKQNNVVHSSTPREQVRQQSTSQTKQRGPFVHSQRASQTTIDVTNKTTWSIRPLPESKSHNNRRHKQNNVVHSSTPREQVRQQSTSQTKQRGPFVHSQRASQTTIDVTNKTTWSICPLPESKPNNDRRQPFLSSVILSRSCDGSQQVSRLP